VKDAFNSEGGETARRVAAVDLRLEDARSVASLGGEHSEILRLGLKLLFFFNCSNMF
jgi:hypothetical protein